jgi:transcriptional regulator
MYTPAHFREDRPEQLDGLIRQYPLATLVVQTAAGLDAHHLPMLLVRTDSAVTLTGHVARANPVWQDVADGAAVLVIFSGPDHYVSPNWYPSKHVNGEAVPTWNYATVHVHGTVHFQHDADSLRPIVDALTSRHESARPQPWSTADAPASYMSKMLTAIVGFRIEVRRMEGKWKSSQNRTAADLDGVGRGLAADGLSEPAIAHLARQRPDA